MSCCVPAVALFEPPVTTPMPSIEQALEQFARATNSDELLKTARVLAQTRDPRAIEPLVRSLTFNNPELFEVAVQGLVGIGEPAVQPLIDCLDRVDYGARYQALRALVAIGDPRPRSAYEYWIGADIAPSVRRMCVKGLKPFPDAEPLLLPTLKDGDWSVRYTAVLVLAERGLTPEIQAAIAALESDPERVVRLKAAQALAQS